MDNPGRQGTRDPNEAFRIAIKRGPLDQEDLSNIEFLFTIGADANFVSATYKRTPLMQAVHINEPELVELLLERGALINARHRSNKFARGFNLIYKKDAIKNLIRPIGQAMLNVDMHNNQSDEKIEYQDVLCPMQESIILCNALLIDKMLEDNNGFSGIIDSNHPLLLLLRKPRIRRAVGYALDGDFENIPLSVRVFYVLGNEKIIA